MIENIFNIFLIICYSIAGLLIVAWIIHIFFHFTKKGKRFYKKYNTTFFD